MVDAAITIPGVPQKHSRSLVPLLFIAGVGYLAYRASNGRTVAQIVDGVVTDVTNVPGSLTSTPTVTAGPKVPASAPLGIKNNNPGNLMPSLIPFKGTSGTNGGKVVFTSPVWGIRAMFKLLQNYQKLYSIDTIAKIGNRWTATDVAAWITNVAHFAGIAANAPINLSDPTTASKIVHGIIGAENGSSWASFYGTDLFSQAWGLL